MITTKRAYSVKGRVVDKEGRPLAGISVKAFGKKGDVLAGARTDREGRVEFESGVAPRFIRLISEGQTVHEMAFAEVDMIHDFGEYQLLLVPLGEWHIEGAVTDQPSGDPLQGMLVEVWDHDATGADDPLGDDHTDADGRFGVWFDTSALEESESYPDLFIRVKNSQDVVVHETEVDWNISGEPHSCSPYAAHKGKEYEIVVDYVTLLLNKVGPVDAADIDGSGRVEHNGVSDRPFGGSTSIGGRIWGAKADQWKLYYAEGFVDSGDARFTGLQPDDDDPSGLNLLAQGSNKIWDGLIHTWDTTGLEGTHTAILVVWDADGNEYHDTQILFLHNTAIEPPAEISSPAAGSAVSKGAGAVEIEGTASDDYFRSYQLHWVGPTQTELTTAGIAYPAAGNQTEVLAGTLGEWDVSSLPEGPYCLRLTVIDRTLVNDGYDDRRDWTWNTLTLTA